MQALVFFQVVVAVLLESFYSARQHFKEEEARIQTERDRKQAARDARDARARAASGMVDVTGAESNVEDQRAAVLEAAELEAAAELQLDPLMEKLADGFDTGVDLSRRIDTLFDRSVYVWMCQHIY